MAALYTLAALTGTTPAIGASPEAYDIDVDASRIRVHVDRAGLLGFLGHDHDFEAPLSEGRLEVDRDDPGSSLVDLHWDASALAVVPGTEPAEDVPEVERQMRGPEVLDVEAHPRIRFWSFEVDVREADPGAGRWGLHLRGGLEIKGARHTVEMDVEVRSEGDKLTANGRANLRLSRLGVHPPSVAGVVKVADDFRVVFEVHARRRPARPAPSGSVLDRSQSRAGAGRRATAMRGRRSGSRSR